MGGRGASSGTYELNVNGNKQIVKYGSEYHAVHEYGNAKFIVKNEGSTTAPMETMSGAEGRVYVTIDKKTNGPVSVAYYDKDGFIYKEVDFKDHRHGIHAHEIDYHGGPFERNGPRKPSAAELREARMLKAIWKKAGLDVTRKKS